MKYSNWPERLADIVSISHNKPFEWGTHDCCAFAAKVVFELTGVDYFAQYAGYTNALEAAHLLKKYGGVRGIATLALGAEIPPLFACRGDILMVQTVEHGDTLAVCIGTKCVAPGVDSLQSLPVSTAITAWRVL